MLWATLSFFLGVLTCQQLPVLPPLLWWLLCLSSLALSFLLRKHRLLVYFSLFLFALSWSAWRADILLEQRLPKHWQQQDVRIQGKIVSLPTRQERATRFEFVLQQLQFQQQNYPLSGRIRLDWYDSPEQAAPDLRSGQHWQFWVRLKRPHSSLNAGGFDFESWLFQKRIMALGYVRQQPAAQLLQDAPHWRIETLRSALQQAQQAHFSTHPHHGLLGALSIGERGGLTEQHWQLFRATGTSHLMAISGLHVGLVGLLMLGLSRLLYRYLGGRWLLYLPAFYPSAVIALLAAFFYALLAGFSIPTQRAVLMLAVVLGSRLFKRNLPLTQGFALALWAVLLYDPLAVLSSGFWLSFGAVFTLLYAFSGQTPPTQTWRELLQAFHQVPSLFHFNALMGYWLKRLKTWLFAAQVAVFIGLTPLLLWWFGQLPLTSVAANAIAIPWVGLLIVPLVLLGSLTLLILPDIGIPILQIALRLIDWLMAWLNFWAATPFALWSQATPPAWSILLAGVGAFLLLLPAHFPARWLGVFWFLPAVLYSPKPPEVGEFRFTLLDVSQGLAAVVQTRQHVLVYDTGTDFFGKAVVVPYLRSQDLQKIDILLISHADWDHIGGAQKLLKALPVEQIISNAPAHFSSQADKLKPCLRGQSWRWDGVLFEILHPAPDSDIRNDNDGSCVLKISTAGSSLLLTGDIEKRAEVKLYLAVGAKLSADVLVVPHHGSRTSSLSLFIKKVNPHYALLPVGYLNRYRLPHPQVVQRYQQQGVKLLSSAQDGAIGFYFGEDSVSEPRTAREQYQRYWRN